MRNRPRHAGAVPFAAAPFLLAGVVVTAVMAWVWARLPAELGVHFGPDGTADQFMSRPVLLAMIVILFLALAAWLGALAYWGGVHGGALTGGSTATAVGLGYLFAALFLVNTDVTDASGLRFPWWHLAAAVGAALLTGLAAGRLLPAPTPPRPPGPGSAGSGGDPTPLPSVGLRRGEVAVWQRSLGPVWLTAAGAALTLAAAGAWATGAAPGAVAWAVPVGLLVLALSGARVTVGVPGLALRLPFVGVPMLRVPLERVARAEAREVRPVRDLGGWGYRVLPGRRGVALTAGTGVWVELKGGSQCVVVVRDAHTAAGLLNDLVARARC